MAKVKWGVLGTANIARGCTIPGMKLAQSCELYAIAGRSLEKAEAYRKEFGFEKAYGSYEALLDDPEVQAVYIPLPNHLHIPWVLAALEKGKHVLCEKPMALHADDAEKAFEAAEKNGVLLMEAYAYLHTPYLAALREDLGSGIIGDVQYIETAFVTQGYEENVRLYKEMGGGAMYDLGCYCTTMMLTLLDSDPEEIRAVAEFSDLGVDNMTSAIIRFKNGARGAFNVGMILGKDTNARYDHLYIYGSQGFIKSDVEYNQQGDVSYRIYTGEGVTERKITVPQNYSLEIEQLSRCILYGETPFVTRDFTLRNARFMDRVFEEIGW